MFRTTRLLEGHARRRPAGVRAAAVLTFLGLLAWGAVLPAAEPEAPATQARVDSSAAVDTTAAATAADSAASSPLLAYYFHTTRRCASCLKIEAYTREAIETGFAAELKSGRLVFLPVNLDDEGNEHFVKDYQLFTKSVVLVRPKAGKQADWKNLPKVWELLNDKDKFVRYIQEETRAWLAGGRS